MAIFRISTKNYLLYLIIICIIVLLRGKIKVFTLMSENFCKDRRKNVKYVFIIIISFMKIKFNAFFKKLYAEEYNIYGKNEEKTDA
jgi:hypothetical protein